MSLIYDARGGDRVLSRITLSTVRELRIFMDFGTPTLRSLRESDAGGNDDYISSLERKHGVTNRAIQPQ